LYEDIILTAGDFKQERLCSTPDSAQGILSWKGKEGQKGGEEEGEREKKGEETNERQK
jgi:hypothetical protein